MVAPCCHPCCGTACAVGLKFPLFLCFGCHFKSPQGWQFERSSHKFGRSKDTDPQGWEKGVFERPRSFLFQVLHRRFSTQRTQSVRRCAASETEGPLDGPLRHVLFYLFRGAEAVAYFLCLGAHKVRTRPPRGRCSLSWTVTGSKSLVKAQPNTTRAPTRRLEGPTEKPQEEASFAMDHEVKGERTLKQHRAPTRLPRPGIRPLVRLGRWFGLTVCGFLGHFCCGFVAVVGLRSLTGKNTIPRRGGNKRHAARSSCDRDRV